VKTCYSLWLSFCKKIFCFFEKPQYKFIWRTVRDVKSHKITSITRQNNKKKVKRQY
jgi:hypothetical protein